MTVPMRDRDVEQYARTLVKLRQALDRAEDQGMEQLRRRIQHQIDHHPYDHERVVQRADQLTRDVPRV